jgi:hypothetical protein
MVWVWQCDGVVTSFPLLLMIQLSLSTYLIHGLCSMTLAFPQAGLQDFSSPKEQQLN